MQEKRKSIRRNFERPAWIVTGPGAAPIQCAFRDLSKAGARLRVPPQQEFPHVFTLNLSASGTVARKCVTVWRSEDREELGVEFTGRLVGAGTRVAETEPAV
jgi:hypothetical protein